MQYHRYSSYTCTQGSFRPRTFVSSDIPVYASEITRNLIGTNRLFFKDQIDEKRITAIEAWKPIFAGPFKITAHPVDHSAPGAIAVEAEADG